MIFRNEMAPVMIRLHGILSKNMLDIFKSTDNGHVKGSQSKSENASIFSFQIFQKKYKLFVVWRSTNS